MTRELPAEAAALFREAPEGFVAARDALVRRLREDGRDDDAAAVKALRKPTAAVAALNQLAVRDPEGVHELLDAGSELRAAQQAALSSSRGAGRMREAAAARRDVVARLTAAATEALSDAGHAAATQEDRIRGALEAASVDPDVGARLRAGTLEGLPTEAPGFGDVFGLTAVEGEAGGEGAGGARPRRRRGEAGPDLAALRAEVATLRRDRDAAARHAERDRRALDRLARELDEARARVRALEERHAEADAAAAASAPEAKRA
ncbi:MAG TPA: hypothetical protein VF044_05700, partial [Actinomycetota bacterium]